MNLNQIKQRLESLSKAPNASSSEKKNVFFKPSVGKQTIRVVPSEHNKDFPFTEMAFYYFLEGKTIASPINWGEKDPVVDFAKQLRKTNDKENWKLAKKLDPKTRIFVPVVVRGEESEGVKLWNFGKETYQDFLNMAADEEIGDFTNILTGRDIKLNTVGPEVTGTKFNKTTISTSLKITPLSEDSQLVDSFLKNQPDPLKIFKKYTFEELKQMLQEWLSPEEEENTSQSSPDEDETSAPVSTNSKYSLNLNAKKTTNADKFDELFND